MVRFIANTVVVDDSDEDFILVGFADEQDERCRESLHFQRSYEFDEQDVALGMDQVYVERGDQSAAAYGGIVAVELQSDRIRVFLDPRAAAELGSSEFEIGFALTAAEFARLQVGLRVVFQGFLGLREHTADTRAAADG